MSFVVEYAEVDRMANGGLAATENHLQLLIIIAIFAAAMIFYSYRKQKNDKHRDDDKE